MLAVMSRTASEILLPPPRRESRCSLEQALWERRSVREFGLLPLGIDELSQLAWAAQGTASGGDHRTAPSAGALYPMNLRVAVGNVRGATPGLYRYRGESHRFLLAAAGDRRRALAAAALQQSWIAYAPAVFVLSGVDSRATAKYGARGTRYLEMEAGHAAQNLLLQAAALELGAVVVGAFDDRALGDAALLDAGERALCLVPVGHPA